MLTPDLPPFSYPTMVVITICYVAAVILVVQYLSKEDKKKSHAENL